MRIFEKPRRVVQPPTFQFHYELSAKEVEDLQRAFRNNVMPGCVTHLLQHTVMEVDPRALCQK